MNNYCRNCGQKLEEGVTVCQKCNAEVFIERINVEEKKEEITKFKIKEKNYVIIILLMYFSSIFLSFGLENKIIFFVSPLLALASYIMLIYARITMYNSRMIKIMFNIFLILFIIKLIYIIMMMVACVNIIKWCY